MDEDTEFLTEVITRTVENKEGTGNNAESYTLAKEEIRREVTVYWKLLHEERKLLTVATTAALRSNIEERKVRLAERGVSVLEAAVAAALTDLGLNPHDEHVRLTVGKRMREALEAGNAGGGGLFLGTEMSPSQVLEGEVVSAASTTSPFSNAYTPRSDEAEANPVDF